MKALVNGEEWELAADTTVADVMFRLRAPESGIAVAHRGALLPRAAWPDTPVRDGDEIEVLTAVQGG
ncbi:MAG TPA: sulfur carrier protein ThiS [Pseudonocardiaceae bacterium]|jgi:sulfur carrier protein|nr:sulfur carrier protein ThiS [Pseudonocardiaceae bacterium]